MVACTIAAHRLAVLREAQVKKLRDKIMVQNRLAKSGQQSVLYERETDWLRVFFCSHLCLRNGAGK
jgi:hypothetical protein